MKLLRNFLAIHKILGKVFVIKLTGKLLSYAYLTGNFALCVVISSSALREINDFLL